MAKPGSEAAHEEQLRKLAGPAAAWIFASPKRYPKLDADIIDRQTKDGNVCLVNDRDARILFYRQDDQVNALVTELVHSGYRRRYRKLSGSSAMEIIDDLNRR